MKTVFWALCALISWSYLVYPLLIQAVAMLAGRRYRRDDRLEPRVSILIPVYNEERVIAAKIDNALALDYPAEKLEILVASESNDRTDDLVETYIRQHVGRVRLLKSVTRRGKVAKNSSCPLTGNMRS